MTIRFWSFLKILGKFFLPPILPADYVTRRTLLLAGTIRVCGVLFTTLIRVGDTHHKAFGQNAEELLDFRGERHFFWYSTPETPGIYGLFPPG